MRSIRCADNSPLYTSRATRHCGIMIQGFLYFSAIAVFVGMPAHEERAFIEKLEWRLEFPLFRHPQNMSAQNIEELEDELGAAFLCADLGITPEPRPDHASYIDNWLNILDQG